MYKKTLPKGFYTHPYTIYNYVGGGKKGMKAIDVLKSKWKKFMERDDAMQVMAAVIGVMFLGFGVLMLFVLGGVVAPGLYEMGTDALNITSATALEMQADSAESMQQGFQIAGMVMMIIGFVMVIASLWDAIPFFRGGRGGM